VSNLRWTARRTLRSALVFLVLLVLIACGGGGGGGPTEPTPPPPPPPGITFTAAGGGANSISLGSGAATNETTLFLEVRATSVTDLYGVAFDLRFPNAVLQFVRATDGGFLGGGTVQVAETATGTLVAGASKLGAVAGSTGSGVLMVLEFRAVAAGSGTFTFADNTALNATGSAVPNLTWAAGNVTVVR
jgi:hypothetical protein